ncbi:helix-turn-helix transcriptional regulator [Solwaraspora sp. WMMD406]|uniref:helix-turn-helix domain-containing protein n=1 Tax=Solwaraspora sp. WMMD406 TaxID=3016095 RepID=UPI002416CD63|nr:helix-turn-helix transcriptional regulator [Solwaraspora sp. WMMD406]MDG4765731.1 helix-turn-helix transcriptional regulator [Solwaraspora sp. WMMD406]
MTAPISNSSVPRRRLGQELRRLRERQDHVSPTSPAGMLRWPAIKLYRMERGEMPVRAEDVALLCELYGAEPSMTEALVGLAAKTREKGWWHDYASLPPGFDVYAGFEETASRLRIFHIQLIPGLLQTKEYATTVIDANVSNAHVTYDVVTAQLARASVLTRIYPTPPDVDVVLDESALLRTVGTPEIMADQLRRVVDAGQLPNVSVRVLPFAAGLPAGTATCTPFTILDFPDASEPTIVHHEMLTGALFLDKQTEVDLYAQAYDNIRSACLSEDESRELLLTAARTASNS